MRNIFVTLFIAVLLSACGNDESGETKAPATPAETSAPAVTVTEEGPGEITPGVAKDIGGIMIVDHTRDEKEFELRRSISGVQSMIDNAKQAGQNTAELEARLGELQKQLKDLLAG